MVEFRGAKHKLVIDLSIVHPCITSKLQSEPMAHKHREEMFVTNADKVEPEYIGENCNKTRKRRQIELNSNEKTQRLLEIL